MTERKHYEPGSHLFALAFFGVVGGVAFLLIHPVGILIIAGVFFGYCAKLVNPLAWPLGAFGTVAGGVVGLMLAKYTLGLFVASNSVMFICNFLSVVAIQSGLAFISRP